MKWNEKITFEYGERPIPRVKMSSNNTQVLAGDDFEKTKDLRFAKFYHEDYPEKTFRWHPEKGFYRELFHYGGSMNSECIYDGYWILGSQDEDVVYTPNGAFKNGYKLNSDFYPRLAPNF